MEKTITCADCNAQYTYNETPGYPRKYCEVCSAKRKADFTAKTPGYIPPIANKGVAQAVAKNVEDKFTTMYVSYCKDVFNAICSDHKGADANSLINNMTLSIDLIKQAREAFK